MKALILCFLSAEIALATEPHWTELGKKTNFDERAGVREELYQSIDDNSFQRVGELIVANVRTVTQTTYPSGEWVESVSVTKTGFNCNHRKQGPLQAPLSSSVVLHNVNGTVTDVTSALKVQFPATKIGLNEDAGPDDKDFAYACSRRW